MTLPLRKRLRQRALDPHNRRSTNIEDRRSQVPDFAPIDSAGYGGAVQDVRPDLTKPIPLPVGAASVSPHEVAVARYRAESARTGEQVDEEPVTVVRKKRGLRNVRISRDRK